MPVLQDITFKVEAGEFLGLLGPSGCGKSTLLRLAAGLEPPLLGRILTGDTPIEGPDPSRVVVFQDPTLFPWRRVWDNVALGLEAQGLLKTHRARVDEALNLVGLAKFAKAYPHQLSGGMAQRVALARALVNDPELLILDEPLGKLNSLTRISMQGEIVRLWQQKGFTALLVTHDIEEALLMCTRVIVFSERPAESRRIFPSRRLIRATATIRNLWPCAAKSWGSSVSNPLGELTAAPSLLRNLRAGCPTRSARLRRSCAPLSAVASSFAPEDIRHLVAQAPIPPQNYSQRGRFRGCWRSPAVTPVFSRTPQFAQESKMLMGVAAVAASAAPEIAAGQQAIPKQVLCEEYQTAKKPKRAAFRVKYCANRFDKAARAEPI